MCCTKEKKIRALGPLQYLQQPVPDFQELAPCARRGSAAEKTEISLGRHNRTSVSSYHVQVVADESVAAHRSPEARRREGADDARANKDGQVEAVLRVPFRC